MVDRPHKGKSRECLDVPSTAPLERRLRMDTPENQGGDRKPAIEAVPHSGLVKQLAAFLPHMERANRELEAAARRKSNPAELDIEHLTHGEQAPHIEMDLACGVLDLQDDAAVAAAERAAASGTAWDPGAGVAAAMAAALAEASSSSSDSSDSEQGACGPDAGRGNGSDDECAGSEVSGTMRTVVQPAEALSRSQGAGPAEESMEGSSRMRGAGPGSSACKQSEEGGRHVGTACEGALRRQKRKIVQLD